MSTIHVTINFNDPDADAEEREEDIQKLLVQLEDLDEIESVHRVLDPNPPVGNKSFGGFLVGLVSAEVSATNFKKLMGFLSDRLGNKPIELEVEANNKKLKVKAGSREELEAAIQAAKDFVGK